MKLLSIAPTSLEFIEHKKPQKICIDCLNDLYLNHIGHLEEMVVRVGLLTPLQFNLYYCCDGETSVIDIAIKIVNDVEEIINQLNLLIKLGLLEIAEIRQNNIVANSEALSIPMIPFEMI